MTYVSIVVHLVVCQFEFVKRHDLFHPLSPSGGTVRMDVYPWRRHWICLSSNNPTWTIKKFYQFPFSRKTILFYLWKAYRYLLSSNGTKSIINIYSACGSRPHSLTWNVGNILLPAFVTIISVPRAWNSSQRGFISRRAPAVLRAGFKEEWLERNWFTLLILCRQIGVKHY